LVLGGRIALAYRASLGGASQITSTALQIARIFDHVTWCGFGVIQVAGMRSWSTADLNLVGRNEIRSAMSARSRRPVTSIRAQRQRNDGDLGAHYGSDITRNRLRRPAAAMTGLDGYRK
jgi:hypothetical protein